MPDRTDIDALLIGALYGELSPADEARLTAHLESHPADRTALSDLTRTRAAVRESRILAFQAEPPQAISALLLREASRRAPRQESATASWFQRFVHAFMAHPAMAAAATLVLVLGVAGTLYVSGISQFAEVTPPPAPTAVPPSAAATTETPPAPGGMAPPVEPAPVAQHAAAAEGVAAQSQPEPAAPAQAGQLGQGAAPAAGSAGSVEGYRVRLEEAARNEETARNADVVKQTEAKPPVQKGEAAVDGSLDGFKDRPSRFSAPPTATAPAPAPAKLSKKPAAIEVRTPQPRIEPKELSDDDSFDAPKRDALRRGGTAAAPRGQASGNGIAGPTGGGAAPSPAPPPPPASPPAAMAMPDQAPPANDRETSDAKRSLAKPAPATRPADSPAPAQPRASTAAPSTTDANARGSRADKTGSTGGGDAKAAKADDKTAQDQALLDWARKRKDQVIALVGSNDCRAAATAAGEIYSRAPEYYTANVATDRSIKRCLVYLNAERDRQDRKKAAKRAVQTDDAAGRAR